MILICRILFISLIVLGISCREEISVSPPDVFIPKFVLFVDSNPQGSKIFIDNRNSGQVTPDTIRWLEEGNHLITLKSYIFKDSTITIRIPRDSSVFFDYTSNPTMLGNIYSDSNPQDAEIYLDDSLTSCRTPHLFENLFPGYHTIKYKLAGYWDIQTTVKVVGDRTITVNERMRDSLVWVHFHSVNLPFLPTNWYNDIAIQDGYIKWIASEGAGLIRYDDKEWKFYNTRNSSIPSDNIRSVRISEAGVWIGTDKGAAYLNNDHFVIYNSLNSPLPDKIKCVSPASEGKVWVGSESKGLYYFDGITWTHYNKENSPLGTNYILSLLVNKQTGIVLIGTMGNGILLFDGINWVRTFNALPSPRVDAIEIFENDIWAGCSFYSWSFWNGRTFLLRIKDGGMAWYHNGWSKYPEAGKNIVAAKIDSEGNLWFSDYETGLGKKSSNGWNNYTGFNKINGIAIDGEGNKWFTTLQNGFVKYKGN